jgi:hypothetical protein
MKKNIEAFLTVAVTTVMIGGGAVALALPQISLADTTSTTTMASTTAAIASATAYLQSQPLDAWSIMALAAAGDSPSTSSVATALGGSINTSTATDDEKAILAITAIGQDPRNFNGEDYLSDLENFYSTSTNDFDGTSVFNNDIFGLLALSSAGVSSTDPMIVGTRSAVLAAQNADGGWGYAVGVESDSNDTASVLWSLLATGSNASDTAVQNGLSYLKTLQNPDGGFTYDPVYGTSTDADSDAWALSTIYAIGQDPTSAAWTQGSSTVIDSLLSMQDPTGFFAYQPGYNASDSYDATSYALIALIGKALPVATISAPTMSTTASSTPTSTPTQTNSSGGGGDGAATPTYQISYRIEGPSGDLCDGNGLAVTAFDVLGDANSNCGLTYHVTQDSLGSYVDQIGAYAAAGANGWLYTVDGVQPSVAANDYDVKNNDSVVWYFGNENGTATTSTTAATSTTSTASSTSTNTGGGGGTSSTTNNTTTSTSTATGTGTGTVTSTAASPSAGVVLGASTTALTSGNPSAELVALEQELATLEFQTQSCSFQFNKNLARGADNADVKNLQTALDYIPMFIGGSAIPTTGYFGNQTAAAVIDFQNLWVDKILTPNGLTTGSGFVGVATRAVLNSLCSAN